MLHEKSPEVQHGLFEELLRTSLSAVKTQTEF